MIHIVFSDADAKILQEVINLDETLAGEVVTITDDYSVGPIENIYVGEGRAARKNWWLAVLAAGDFSTKHLDDETNDYTTIAQVVGTLRRNEEEQLYIWAAQNSRDVCGYYWLLHFVKPFQGRVQILYLNNLPFINEKGNIFYPEYLHQIPAKEFLKAKKLAREITLSELEVDPDEWQKLMTDNKTIRLLEGGKKLAQHDETFFDTEIKKFVGNDFQKATKIVQQYQSKSKVACSEAYLIWRLKTLTANNIFEMQGEGKSLKEIEFKLLSKVEHEN
ncbi:DUF1835 domain-containing protein [Ferruginibacter yonginensis]|uniref:DUF1835 domain-containing protein n=1 Tax=Ferruginibacter yonginensis TaxID=1310416 RepID=A0ABV8QP81_9BACT